MVGGQVWLEWQARQAGKAISTKLTTRLYGYQLWLEGIVVLP